MDLHRFFRRILYLLTCLIVMAGIARAQTPIEITTPVSPPGWALLERELLRANSEACEKYFDYYFDDRGYYLHVPTWGTLAGTDDAAENFRHWNMLYSLGGSESLLKMFRKGYEGHLLQYKETKTVITKIAVNGCYYREFLPMSDAFHTREGVQSIIQQGLSFPSDMLYQKRMRRFAGFYMNEDPETPNYDPEHKIIRSLWTGSKGPMLWDAIPEDWAGDPVEGKFHVLHGTYGAEKMEDFMEAYPNMLLHEAADLHSTGDYPANLYLTCLALHSYMLGHEEKYKDWLLEYVDAWKERTIENGGNIPANIGLDGTIGGEFGGKWYKGKYGWNESRWDYDRDRIHHINTISRSMWIGFGNAFLISGDRGYIDVLRKQMDNFYAQKKIVDGKLMLPFNYGDFDGKTGWYNWTPPRFNSNLIQLYLWSMDRKDLERVTMTGWLSFLEGKDPDYPEKQLKNQFAYIRSRMERMRKDPTSPDTRLADWAMGINPATSGTLVNLMLGGYTSGKVYNLHCRVRYFDPDRRRPGIPEDVAALVTGMDNEIVKVALVNINPVESRDVIVQTGGYGEHQCTRVEIGGRKYMVNNRFFTVRLAPGAGTEMVIYCNRYANKPTLAFPWHGDTVPVQ